MNTNIFSGVSRTAAALTVAAILGSVGFLAAVSVAKSASEARGTVSLRRTDLGMILVNSHGRTLYLFGKDRHGRSSCSGACAQNWPPLIAHGRVTAGGGVRASLLGTTRRPGGVRQVTYNHHPLYTFAGDSAPGDTNGEGLRAFGAKWWAVSARGTAVTSASGTTTSIATTATNDTSTTITYPYP
jgi:predicted lipoprotein with Yx(FWY)xxD motif